MKKLFSIALFAVMVLGWGATFAQCNIVTPNTNPGLTPASPDTITQNIVYAQTQQVYVPATYSGNGIDSVHVSSITGLPAGITYSFNPVDGGGGTVNGGANGAICFAGTTTASPGKYPLTFNGDAYVVITGVPGVQTVPLSAAPLLADTFIVKAQPVQPSSCDTLFNLTGETPANYTAGVTADSGYVAGNNIYGDIAKAEGFAAVTGDYVNSAILFFSVAAIAPADTSSLVTIGVWDNSGTSDAGNAGAPGTMIDSAHVTLGQIAQAVAVANSTQSISGLLVNFVGGVALTTDTFYVGVILPTAPGDSIALFTNSTPGVNGDGWELNAGPPATWGTYNDDWGFGGNIGNYIVANICSTIASGYPSADFTASSATVCTAAPVSFTDASSATPAASYWGWSFGDGTSSSLQNPTHAYTAAGTYTVNEYVSNNLGNGAVFQTFVSASTTITVNASPTAATSTTYASSASAGNGGVMVSAASGTPPYTYAWSADNSTSDTIANLNPGTYTVTVTDANTCTTTASATVYVTGVITLSDASTVKIYPNPATDVLNLVWSQKSNAEVSIVDLNGNVISTVITNGDMKTVYDIHNLSSGNYIVRITDKTSNQQQSLLFSKF